VETPTKVAAGFLSLGRVPYTGPSSSCPYSLKCLEVEFCELRRDGVLGSSGSYRGALQRKEGDVVLLLPSVPYERR
jgi:hypothetical protein